MEISVRKTALAAEEYFKKGLFCSEAVVAAVADSFDVPQNLGVLSAAAGFGGGMGRGSVCGALSGGVMAIGMILNCEETRSAEKAQLSMALSAELTDAFEKYRGNVMCGALTEGLDMAKGENMELCTSLVSFCAGKAAEIIAREKGLKVID